MRSARGLLRQGDPGFAEAVRRPFRAHENEPVPALVARCGDAQDVADALAHARRERLPVAVCSGGRRTAGRSATGGLLIDLSPMDSIRLVEDRAIAGPGTSLAALAAELAPSGLVVPAGVCPTAGLGGLVLDGGWGLLGRMYGLTCDHLETAEVVLADGRVVTAGRETEPDLLWALRGGGGHFGVLTSLVLRTRPVPELTSFRYGWSYAHAARLMEVWQRWGPDAPRELTAGLLLSAPADPALPASAELVGAMAGTPEETTARLAEFCARAGAEPEATEVASLGYLETIRYHGTLMTIEPGPPSDPAERPEHTGPGGRPSQPGRYRVVASEFFDRSLPREAAGRLAGLVVAERRAGEARRIELVPWGGAYGDVRWHATAFVHRERRYSIRQIVLTDDPAAARRWVRRSRAAVRPWGTGSVYPDAPDPELHSAGLAYYGANLARLRELKTRFDPGGVLPPLPDASG